MSSYTTQLQLIFVNEEILNKYFYRIEHKGVCHLDIRSFSAKQGVAKIQN